MTFSNNNLHTHDATVINIILFPVRYWKAEDVSIRSALVGSFQDLCQTHYQNNI